MNTEAEKKLLCKEEVYQIVGAAMEVLNGTSATSGRDPVRAASLRKRRAEDDRRFSASQANS
jgi:hypothetical protein